MTRRRREAGLTLLELLVATALFGVIILATTLLVTQLIRWSVDRSPSDDSLRLSLELAPRLRADLRTATDWLWEFGEHRHDPSTLILDLGRVADEPRIVVYRITDGAIERRVYAAAGQQPVARRSYAGRFTGRFVVGRVVARGAELVRLEVDDSRSPRRLLNVQRRVGP